MRDRNNFNYTRSSEGEGFADLTRVAPTEEIRPVHYGESDVGAMQFSGAAQPQQPAGNGRIPEQQSFIPNNYGAQNQPAYNPAPTNFGGNGGFGNNGDNGFGNNGQNNGFGGNGGYVNNGNGGYGAPSGYNQQRISPNQPLQTSERPLVFKNKKSPGQYIYEYRDRLEIYKHTGVGMIYIETYFKNGY